MTDDETRSLVKRFYGVLWNAWDDDAVESVLAEEFEFRGSLEVQTTGRAGWRRYRDMVRTNSPDFHNDIIELVCEQERAAARIVCTGHHVGPLLDVAPTGRRFEYSATAFFRCRNGLLAEAWVLGDIANLRRQLLNG